MATFSGSGSNQEGGVPGGTTSERLGDCAEADGDWLDQKSPKFKPVTDEAAATSPCATTCT